MDGLLVGYADITSPSTQLLLMFTSTPTVILHLLPFFMIYFAVKLPILEFHKLHTITGRTFFQAPYAEHQWQPYFTMARQYKKVEILGLPMFDPAPEALRLNRIPSTHK